MKKTPIKMKLAQLLVILVLAASVSISATAVESVPNTSISESTESKRGMTSEDWTELQSEAEAELNAQSEAKSEKNKSNGGNSSKNQGGSFTNFKNGEYVGSGEWLLVIGIILIVLGAVGVGFVVLMMFRRKKLIKAKAAKKTTRPPQIKKQPQYSDGLLSQEYNFEPFEEMLEDDFKGTRSYSSKSTGRRVAPKSNTNKF